MAREMAEQPEVIGALLGRRHEFGSRLRAIAPERLAGVLLLKYLATDDKAMVLLSNGLRNVFTRRSRAARG